MNAKRFTPSHAKTTEVERYMYSDACKDDRCSEINPVSNKEDGCGERKPALGKDVRCEIKPVQTRKKDEVS
jgi:hypothetical protein